MSPSADGGALSLASAVRERRRAAALSQERLAEQSGVSVRTIRNIEGGRVRAPRLASLAALADALDIEGAERTHFINLGEDGELYRLPDRPDPGRSATGAPNLPVQLTSFVGRTDELASVGQLLSRDRLVTLTGSGGCGKTRLALQAVTRLAMRWVDGVSWVDLGSVAEPERVADVVATRLGVIVEPAGGPVRAVARALQERHQLVCLDCCEHVLEASAELVEELLRCCPGVSVLSTSREPLRVPGEKVWSVPPLNEDEALSLLLDRAVQVRPDFALDTDSEEDARTVCRRLDGIPLAIELAAAWIRVLTPAQVATGLDQRFRLLRARRGWGMVARHRTLEASVDWSYALLEDQDRWVFRQLAVFTGGFTLDAARAVCDGRHGAGIELVDAVGRLVDKSLVVANSPEDTGSTVRYRLLETIRQYAHDRLQAAGEMASARGRHLDHFLACAEAAAPELEQADQDSWLARLEAEHDNLRAALDWGLSATDADRGRRLAAALSRLWLLHGHLSEGRQVLRRAIERVQGDRSILQARLHVGAALVAAAGGEFGELAEHVEAGLDIAAAHGDDTNRGRCLALWAYIQSYVDFGASQAVAAEARRYAEAANDDFGVDLGLVVEGLVLTNGDRHDDARPVLAAASGRSRRRGDRQLAAFALTGQLESAQRTGHLRLASRLAAEAAQLAVPLGDYFTVGTTISNRAWVMAMAGDIDGGLRLMERVVRTVEDEDGTHSVYVPTMALSLAQLHLWNGDLDVARGWFEQASRFGDPLLDNMIVARALPGLAATYRHLGEHDLASHHAERAIQLARRLGQPRILADALDTSAALVAADDPERAEDLHHQALAARADHGLRTFYVLSLDALAAEASRTGRAAEATWLVGASDAGRQKMGYPRPPLDRAHHEATVLASRQALGGARFDTVWAEGHALDLDSAVAHAARGSRERH